MIQFPPWDREKETLGDYIARMRELNQAYLKAALIRQAEKKS